MISALRSIIFYLFFTLIGGKLLGQWQMVFSVPGGVTAMSFSDGIIWAGSTNLYYSKDTGRTWNLRSLPYPTHFDLSFLNQDSGIVQTNGGLFLTTNQGNSWANTSPGIGTSGKIAYTPSGIYTIANNSDLFWRSLDNGQTWQSSIAGEYGLSLAISRDGTIYVVSAAGIAPGILSGELFSSSDQGANWMQATGQFDADCWSIGTDPCDPSQLYLANENSAWAGDGFAKVYFSSDRGTQWNAVFSQPSPYLNGDLAFASEAHLFCTFSNGIMRTTDQGQTWKNIGGPPNMEVDVRTTCAINDNIYFAADNSGNIWATFNGGGDSIASTGSNSGTLSVSPQSLFNNDTVLCDTPLFRSLFIRSSGCMPPQIVQFSVHGPDSSSYEVSPFTGDSLHVSFTSRHVGTQNSQLLLTLSDGTVDTIFLEGTGGSSLPLTMSTADEKTDTIGGDINVPVTIAGLARPENIALTLHYEGDLSYRGSYDASGMQLDMPGEQWPGRSRLNILNVSPGEVAAWARFNAYADSSESPRVTFDSVIVLGVPACKYLAPSSVLSIITPPSGCGYPILSEMLHGELALFNIWPNPTSGNILIESSVELNNAIIEIYDVLGICTMSTAVSFNPHVPIQLTLPTVEGMYYVRVRSEFGIYSGRVVLNK